MYLTGTAVVIRLRTNAFPIIRAPVLYRIVRLSARQTTAAVVPLIPDLVRTERDVVTITWRVKTVLQGTGVTTAAVPNTGRKRTETADAVVRG